MDLIADCPQQKTRLKALRQFNRKYPVWSIGRKKNGKNATEPNKHVKYW